MVTEIEGESAPSNNHLDDTRDILHKQLDDLLETYLELLDTYTHLRAALSQKTSDVRFR